MSFGGSGGGNGSVATSSDVALNNPTDSQILTYSTGLAKWQNKAAAVTDNATVIAQRMQVGLQVEANNGQDGTANHFDAYRTLESTLGVPFDEYSYYTTVNSTNNYTGSTEYTTAIASQLAAHKDHTVFLVLDNYCAHSGDGNLQDTVTALASPTDPFTVNLTAFADAIVAGGCQNRLTISLMHECNSSGTPWSIYVNTGEANANTSALYIQAYQAMVDLMRSRGVTAKFVQWYLTSNSGGALDDYSVHYAGDDYVDELGITYYNRAGLASSGYTYWEPVGHALREPLIMMERMSSRLIRIAESSCVTETADNSKSYYGKSKAEWLRECMRMVRTGELSPRLNGWTLFAVDASGEEAGRNWTLETAEQQAAVASEIRKVRRLDTHSVHDPSTIWNRNLLPLAVEYPNTTTGWSTTGTMALDTLQPWQLDAGVGSIKLTKTVATAGSATSYYLRYTAVDNTFYVPGEAYVLSFWAKSDVSGFLLSPGIRQASSPNTFVGDDNIQLTTGWRQYTVQIASGAAASGAWRVPNFAIGQNGVTGSVWFTGIRFTRGMRPTPPIDRILRRRFATLVDAATITPTIDNYEGGIVTLAGNRTLAAPAGVPIDGQQYELRIMQDATGSRTLTLGTGYAVSSDLPFTTSTAAAAMDVVTFTYDAVGARWLLMQLRRGF